MKPAERMGEFRPAPRPKEHVTGFGVAGARTGGAPIILGAVLLLLAVLVSGSIQTLFRMFPEPILGVILMLAGVQLAWGAGASAKRAYRMDRVVILATAAVALSNVGLAFVTGLALDRVARRGLRRV